jgi:hypothetical protein
MRKLFNLSPGTCLDKIGENGGKPASGTENEMRLQDHLPVDHRLGTVYRYGAGLCGLALLVFGTLGFLDNLAFFSTGGQHVAGLSSNGLLSLISIVFALVLIGGAFVGGNTASTVNMVVGALFVGSGFVNLALLDTSANFLAFRLQNVMFSFAVGLLLLTFGMYGRVGGGLPHDNPYWRARHPEQADHEDRARVAAAAGALDAAGAVDTAAGAAATAVAAGTSATPAGQPRGLSAATGPSR